jgi:hypothetical protein
MIQGRKQRRNHSGIFGLNPGIHLQVEIQKKAFILDIEEK